MANKILVLGASGTGKSTSLTKLDPKSTFIIKVVDKQLPFKSSEKLYNSENKNICTTHDMIKIMRALEGINKMQNIKTLIIDDFNYLMTYRFMEKSKELGYQKYTDMAVDIMNIFKFTDSMRSDLNVYFMAHTQKDAESKVSIKTIGKLLDEKVCIEGLFSIVILALGSDNKYQFTVNGIDPAKSPVGMFETNDIPNDLTLVNEAIKNYFN